MMSVIHQIIGNANETMDVKGSELLCPDVCRVQVHPEMHRIARACVFVFQCEFSMDWFGYVTDPDD